MSSDIFLHFQNIYGLRTSYPFFTGWFLFSHCNCKELETNFCLIFTSQRFFYFKFSFFVLFCFARVHILTLANSNALIIQVCLLRRDTANRWITKAYVPSNETDISDLFFPAECFYAFLISLECNSQNHLFDHVPRVVFVL